ncbi:ATP-binding protein [Streptomyces sp. NPDC059850]|uniref:ATP-binding protein n=1 Tax=Streptomyces sp. NPDC059850 TaxID=3346970 RepID=UPI00365A0631
MALSPEDVMTTTAVRTPRAVLRRDGDVMEETFPVAPCRRGEPPRDEDTVRVRRMRRIAAAKLRYCGLEPMTDDVLVIVSELVTNAILHSGTREITLTLTLRKGLLRIKVHDGMEGWAQPKQANSNAESGRGLEMVERLVEEYGGAWGISDDRATVWCDLPARGEDQ